MSIGDRIEIISRELTACQFQRKLVPRRPLTSLVAFVKRLSADLFVLQIYAKMD
jgi:hypothetical protein